MDWSTLACGRGGHVTYAPDEPHLRAQLTATLAAGEAWRCLRCGMFVPGPPDAIGPADQAPLVPRGKEIRSRLILRVFALERFVRAAIFIAASYLLWRFRSSQNSIERAFDRELPLLRDLFRQLGFNIDHSKLVGLLQHALTLSSHSITLLAIGAALYAAIELVEAVGLWLARRWGEYFAMVATSLGLPLEIYDLTRGITWLAFLLLAVNLLLVVYLAVTKRLFGIRGGKHAYDAKLREESVLEAAADAAQRQAGGTPPAPAVALGSVGLAARPDLDGADAPAVPGVHEADAPAVPGPHESGEPVPPGLDEADAPAAPRLHEAGERAAPDPRGAGR
jgi:uncharacterized membrane protein (DUF2068 family)